MRGILEFVSPPPYTGGQWRGSISGSGINAPLTGSVGQLVNEGPGSGKLRYDVDYTIPADRSWIVINQVFGQVQTGQSPAVPPPTTNPGPATPDYGIPGFEPDFGDVPGGGNSGIPGDTGGTNLPSTGGTGTGGGLGGALGSTCQYWPDYLQAVCYGISGYLGNDATPGAGAGVQCPAGSTWSAAQGMCVPTGGGGAGTDATPGTVTPGEASTGVTGILLPMAGSVQRYTCPKYPDGKTGILWMNALTGQLVCLPRGVNGSHFGYIRKNKPKPKPVMSAAHFKHLTAKVSKREKTIARTLAKATGVSCSRK